jgi:hypothetical protein
VLSFLFYFLVIFIPSLFSAFIKTSQNCNALQELLIAVLMLEEMDMLLPNRQLLSAYRKKLLKYSI